MHLRQQQFIERCLKTGNTEALKKYLYLVKTGGVKLPIPIKIGDVHKELIEIYRIHKTIDDDLDNKTFSALVNQLKVTFLKVDAKDNRYILECYISKNLAEEITKAGDKYPTTVDEMMTHLILDLKRTTYTDKVKRDYEYNKNAPIEDFVKKVIQHSRNEEVPDFLHLQDFTLRVVKPLTDLVLGMFCSKRLGIYYDDACIIREGGILAQLSKGTKTQVCRKLLFNLGTRMNIIYDLKPYVRTMAFLISAVNDGTKLIPCDKQYMINVSYIYPTKKTKPSNNNNNNNNANNNNANNNNNSDDFIKLKFHFKNEVLKTGKKVGRNNNNNEYTDYSNYSIDNNFVKIGDGDDNNDNIPLKRI